MFDLICRRKGVGGGEEVGGGFLILLQSAAAARTWDLCVLPTKVAVNMMDDV